MKDAKNLFQTERLIIVRAKEEDLSRIIEMEKAEDNKKFVWSETYEEHKLEIVDPNYELVLIKANNNKKIIGFCLLCLDFESKKCELKRIVIEDKGKGYGKETLKGILKYVFDSLDMNRFCLDVYQDNIIGIRLYESMGLYCEGVLRQNYKSERGYLDQIIYSLLREEYEKENNKL